MRGGNQMTINRPLDIPTGGFFMDRVATVPGDTYQ